jgi:hypothetical protein
MSHTFEVFDADASIQSVVPFEMPSNVGGARSLTHEEHSHWVGLIAFAVFTREVVITSGTLANSPAPFDVFVSNADVGRLATRGN